MAAAIRCSSSDQRPAAVATARRSASRSRWPASVRVASSWGGSRADAMRSSRRCGRPRRARPPTAARRGRCRPAARGGASPRRAAPARWRSAGRRCARSRRPARRPHAWSRPPVADRRRRCSSSQPAPTMRSRVSAARSAAACCRSAGRWARTWWRSRDDGGERLPASDGRGGRELGGGRSRPPTPGTAAGPRRARPDLRGGPARRRGRSAGRSRR